MQVNDSPPPPTGVAVKEEVCSVGDRAAERAPPGDGFRRALERKRRHRPGSGGDDGAATAAAMAGWFRFEPSVPAGKSAAATAVATPRAVDRVLVGSGPEGAQARIRIGAGALAGTEIQLSSATSSRGVEARLLTHTASSRQTLSVVMDEIRSRLRTRGIVLSTAGAGARRSARAADLQATADDPTAPRPSGGPTEVSR